MKCSHQPCDEIHHLSFCMGYVAKILHENLEWIIFCQLWCGDPVSGWPLQAVVSHSVAHVSGVYDCEVERA